MFVFISIDYTIFQKDPKKMYIENREVYTKPIIDC